MLLLRWAVASATFLAQDETPAVGHEAVRSEGNEVKVQEDGRIVSLDKNKTR